METLFIPTEDDFRKWIKDAARENMGNSTSKKPSADEKDSQLLSRKEIAGYLGISLVTITDWPGQAGDRILWQVRPVQQ